MMKPSIVRLLCALTLSLALGQALHADEPSIELKLSFRSPGQEAFQDEFPSLEEPGVFEMKLDWAVVDPGQAKRDVFLVTISSESGDFASANRGKQRFDGAVKWYQRPSPFYFSARTTTLVMQVDTGARPEGVTGSQNKWDKEARKFVDGPLPACPALEAGQHRFAARVYYREKESKRLVAAVQEFTVTLENAPAPGS